MDQLKKKLIESKRSFRLTVIISIALASIVLYYWYYVASRQISTENAYVDADIMSVNSRMMGYVKEVLVEENQLVKKGDQLLKLDDSDTKIELSYKEAKYKKADADYKRAKTIWKQKGISDAEYELAQATAT